MPTFWLCCFLKMLMNAHLAIIHVMDKLLALTLLVRLYVSASPVGLEWEPTAQVGWWRNYTVDEKQSIIVAYQVLHYIRWLILSWKINSTILLLVFYFQEHQRRMKPDPYDSTNITPSPNRYKTNSMAHPRRLCMHFPWHYSPYVLRVDNGLTFYTHCTITRHWRMHSLIRVWSRHIIMHQHCRVILLPLLAWISNFRREQEVPQWVHIRTIFISSLNCITETSPGGSTSFSYMLSVCLPVYVCMSVGLPVCRSVCMCVCLSACLSVCLSVCLFCLSLSVCLSLSLSVCLYVSLSCRSQCTAKGGYNDPIYFPDDQDWLHSTRIHITKKSVQ